MLYAGTRPLKLSLKDLRQLVEAVPRRSRNRRLLVAREVAPEVRNRAFYLQFLKEGRSFVPQKPYEFSNAPHAGAPDSKNWVFQGNPQYYDVVGALRDCVVKTWKVNQQKKDVHPGDGFIVWVTGETAGSCSLAMVMSEVHTATEDSREASYRYQPVQPGPARRLGCACPGVRQPSPGRPRAQPLDVLPGCG